MSFKTDTSGKKKENGRKRVVLWVLAIIIAIGLFAGYKVFGPNASGIPKDKFLYIRTGSSYQQVKDTLARGQFVNDIRSFDLLAKKAGYPERVKAGKYRIKNGMSNYAIIRMLRSGSQVPVKLVINKLRTKQDFIRYVAAHLEADSTQLKQLMQDPSFLSQYGLDEHTAMCLVLPDSYEFWWNTGARKTLEKFAGYYKKYWTPERIAKARTRNLSPQQAYIMASIVEEETNNHPEKPLITSVYLNRVKIGMPLQADPTVKFAVGDFSIKRVTSAITTTPSPYNTYYTKGLPPGPICTPSKKTLEAVLNAPETKYLYFCAKEDFSGAHSFATNYDEHQKNAQRYQQALNARGIH
jgi:UPF0755 protein